MNVQARFFRVNWKLHEQQLIVNQKKKSDLSRLIFRMTQFSAHVNQGSIWALLDLWSPAAAADLRRNHPG